MKKILLGIIGLLLIHGSVLAQNTQSDTAALGQKLKDMEERIIALEGQVRQLKSQGPTAVAPAPGETGAAPATTQPEATVPSSAGEAAPSPSFGGATNAGKALNPDISVIGDFLGAVGRQTPFTPTKSLELHESEIGLQAIIDPYARGDFFISFGEEGVNVEEGFITFTALPAGFVAKVGKMRAAFGKVNTLHNHVLPWTDRPLVTNNLVGGEDGIDDAGLSVTRAFAGPKDIFLEATAQLFRGDSGDLFSTNGRRNNVSTVAHLRGYRDINESTNVDIGVSYARGHNDSAVAALPLVGLNPVTSLYGTDATIRWKPLRRSIYHSFVGRGEFIWSQRQQPVSFVTSTIGLQRAFGFYASGDYQLARRWFIGGRYDRSDEAANAAVTDSGGSAVITYWPSEFAQLRTQYRRTNSKTFGNSNELLFQVQFSLGAHGAHPF
jgi:hypothetical protein